LSDRYPKRIRLQGAGDDGSAGHSFGARTYVAVISLGAISVTLAIQAVSPGLPELQAALDLSNTDIGWFTTAYVLPGALLTVPLGIVGDHVGRRRLFCAALAIYGLAGVVQGTTTSYPVMLTMRVVQGACFAAAMPLSITLIGEAFSGHMRIRGLAGRNAILNASEVVLPLVGAFLATLTWRAPLLVQSVAIVLAVASFLVIEEQATRSGGKRKYVRELLRVIRTQTGMFAVLLSAASRFLFKFVMYGWLPILLVTRKDASLTQVGVVISVTSLVAVVIATRVPWLVRKVRPSWLVMGSVVTLGVTTALFTVAGTWTWALVVGAIYGIGDGILSVLLDTYALHTSRSHVRAGMVSVSQMARNLGKLSSPVVMTAIVAISSLEVGFVVMGLIGVAMAPLMLPLLRMDRDLQAPDDQEEAEATTPGEPLHYE
jgi:MFS transporter, ACDE family, multidrug resistance protein